MNHINENTNWKTKVTFYSHWEYPGSTHTWFCKKQFVIFKPLSYCFEETIGFDVKALFTSLPVSHLISWYKNQVIQQNNFEKRLFSSTGLFMDWKSQTESMVSWFSSNDCCWGGRSTNQWVTKIFYQHTNKTWQSCHTFSFNYCLGTAEYYII